jgi:di/tricarboxylate transporter
MWITLGILSVAIILFVTEWLRVDLVSLCVVIVLMLTNILSTQEAIAGFSNAAVLTIASLFVIGGAVMQTGLAGAIGERILRIAGDSPTRLLVVIMITVALLSGFMSDTGTVAVLLPVIISLTRNVKISPSKLLIPLSFGALLGGAMTLIGTPPNIIVSDLLREQELAPFQFFDYTPLGVTLLVVGIVFMVFAGRHILPDHKPQQDVQRIATPEELIALYRLPDNLYRLRVRRDSLLVGRTSRQLSLGSKYGLAVLEIIPDPRSESAPRVADVLTILQLDESDEETFVGDTIIEAGDILLVQGESGDVSHTSAVLNLAVQPAQSDTHDVLINTEAGVAEVLLPPRSRLVGKTLMEVRFGTLYKLTVLGINRPGVSKKLDLKATKLRFGDTLLVQGPWENILNLRKQRRDFVVMGQPDEMVAAPARRKAPLALVILIGMLALMITGLLPVAVASMLAALAMVLAGCLTIDEAYGVVDWKSVVLIAGMLPMSTALEKVGLVDQVAGSLTTALGSLSPLVVIGSLFLLTSLFTQVLSNTATTVLIAPIALATAQNMNLQPYAFLMAVAIAASMAFASPVASPVNTLVMGAGNYRFSDYIKVGIPLILITLVITVLVLPLLWPL